LKLDEIDAKRVKVAVEADQFFHGGDGVGLRLERLVLAMSASIFTFASPARISRTRFKPSFSTVAPTLPADHVSNGASLAFNEFQSASVKEFFRRAAV
jgi:hypothetical protein